MKKYLLIVLMIGMLSVSATTFGASKPRIFKTFGNVKQMGMFYYMNYDGKSYWFTSMLGGATMRYDPIKKKSTYFSFNREDIVESVTGIEIAHQQVWFGLSTFGMAVYDLNTNKISYYDADNGLSYYGDKISKVSAMAYDRFTDKLWTGLIRAGVTTFDFKTKKWIPVQEKMLKGIEIFDLAVNQKTVAVVGGEKLYCGDKQTGKWRECFSSPDGSIFQLMVLIDDDIYCASRNGYIYQYNIITKKQTLYAKLSTGLDSFIKYFHYFVLVNEKGITFCNIKTKKHKTFNTSYGLISNCVNFVYFDEPGKKMWVLTQYGISTANLSDVMRELKEIE